MRRPGLDLKISSTIGFEKRHNAALAIADEDEFVATALAGLGPQPPNFEAIVELNRGPLLTDGVELLPLAPRQVEQKRVAGALLVDVRTDQQFDDAHIPDAVSIPMLSAGFGSKLAWLADRDQEIVFVGRDDEDGRRAGRLAVAVGIRRLAGFLGGGMTSWRQEKRPVERIERLPLSRPGARRRPSRSSTCASAASGRRATSPARRSCRGTTSTAVPDGLDPERPIAVVCASGQRAAVAASLVKRRGAEHVIHVIDGGVPEWGELGQALEALDRVAAAHAGAAARGPRRLGRLVVLQTPFSRVAHALLRHRALLDDRLLLVEDHLVLLLGDLRRPSSPASTLASVIGSRSTRTSSRSHRHGLLDLFGDDVLAQAHPAALALRRADAQLLLGAGHRVIGGRAGDVAADRALRTVASPSAAGPRRPRPRAVVEPSVV